MQPTAQAVGGHRGEGQSPGWAKERNRVSRAAADVAHDSLARFSRAPHPQYDLQKKYPVIPAPTNTTKYRIHACGIFIA